MSLAGLEANPNLPNGPEEEELTGFQYVERKRLRGGPEAYDIVDTSDGLKTLSNYKLQLEVSLSVKDCVTSPTTDMATLAKQASRKQ